MKKVLKIALILLVLLVVALIAIGFFLGSIIKKGIETVGPRVTKVEMKLDTANLSLLSGNGTLRGFLVGNPEGFKSPFAFKADKISVTVQPGSVTADKVVIRSVEVVGPEIYMHGLGDNLKKIGDNAKGSSGGTTTPSTPETKKADAGASKKLQLDDFLLKDVKVNLVLPGGAGTVPLPKFDIHLQKLGQGADGITGAEVVTAMIGAILEKAGPLAADAIKNGIGNVGKEATKQLDKVTKGVGNLFK